MGSHDHKNVLIKNGDGNVESFVRFVKLFFEKTTTPLSTALVAYPGHFILLNVYA